MNFDHSKALLVMGLRSAGVTDRNVMAAIESVPRELFVPPVPVIPMEVPHGGVGNQCAKPHRLLPLFLRWDFSDL